MHMDWYDEYDVTIRQYVIRKIQYIATSFRPRSTMDSIRVSEAPDTGSIPVEATKAALSKDREVRLFLSKAMSKEQAKTKNKMLAATCSAWNRSGYDRSFMFYSYVIKSKAFDY